MSKTELIIVIEGKKGSFYQKKAPYEQLTLDGLNEFVLAEPARDIAALLERFADKLNMETAADFSVSVLSTEGPSLIQPVIKAIREQAACPQCVELDCQSVLTNVIHHLERDNSLEVDSFGVNYGIANYRIINNKIQTGPFNLLSYTVSGKLLVEHIVDEKRENQ